MEPVAPPTARPVVLAVDVGGTKLAAGLVDATGRPVRTHTAPTPRDASAEQLFDALAGLVDAASGDVAAVGGAVAVCGVGCGGPMARGGVHVSPLNIGGWRRFPLRDRLSAHPALRGLPVAVDNDAKALALGEGWFGAAVGVADYLGMVVSTGVGGGIVVDGRLLDGADGNAGHIGHVIVEPDGQPCVCGARGCLEAEVSGTALARITGRPAAEATPDLVERCGRLVGRAVASVANLLDLRLAVVAGSVALGFGDPFFAAAQTELDRSACLDHSLGTVIRRAALGPDAPLVGAACVGWRALGLGPPARETT